MHQGTKQCMISTAPYPFASNGDFQRQTIFSSFPVDWYLNIDSQPTLSQHTIEASAEEVGHGAAHRSRAHQYTLGRAIILVK